MAGQYYTLSPFFSIFPFVYFPWGKKYMFLRESCRKIPADSAVEDFPQDLIWVCSVLHPKVYRLYFLSVCISASSLLTVLTCLIIHLKLQQLLFRSGFYFLKPLHTFAEVTPSAHTDQKNYHWLDQLAYAFACICDISRTAYFKDKILLSFWIMLRWKKNCYIWWELIVFQICCSWVGLANKY